MKKYFTTHKVAKMFGVSRGSIIRWIHDGKLQAITTAGGHHRISEDAVMALSKILRMPAPFDVFPEPDIEAAPVVLVVDDEEHVCGTLNFFFQKKFPHFQVYEARDGFNAGLMTVSLRPDLILLDLMLPGQDGFAVCAKIRSTPGLEATRIIAITGLQDPAAHQRMLKLGADDFVMKPFDLQLLEKTIIEQLQSAAFGKGETPGEQRKPA